jgi:DNA-binding XRE family transcriptional regulator
MMLDLSRTRKPEQGRFVPSLALAFKVARTFGLRVDEVFEYLDDGQQGEGVAGEGGAL